MTVTTLVLAAVVMAAGGALSYLLNRHMPTARLAFTAYGLFLVGIIAAVVAGVKS